MLKIGSDEKLLEKIIHPHFTLSPVTFRLIQNITINIHERIKNMKRGIIYIFNIK